MNTNLRSGQGHHGLTALLIVLAMLLAGAPAALADHDDRQRDRHDGYGHGDSGRDTRGGLNWEFGVSIGNGPDPWGPGPFIGTQFPSLRGHGDWRWVGAADQYLWFPYVDRSWRPYFYGHWIHTGYGMTWVSYEPWGDVPHHYGNWVFTDHLGWGWVPGYNYSPACVTWGVVSGSIGWAPLPPPWYRSSHHHDYRYDRRAVDYRYGGNFCYDTGLDFNVWVFVSNENFYGTAVHQHALDSRRTLSLFKEKKVLPIGRQLDAAYVKKVAPTKFRTVEMERKTVSFGDRRAEYLTPREQDSKVRDGRKAVERVVVRAPVEPRETDRRKVAESNDGRDTDRRKVAESDESRDTDRRKVAERQSTEPQNSGKTPPEKDPGGKTKPKPKTKGR